MDLRKCIGMALVPTGAVVLFGLAGITVFHVLNWEYWLFCLAVFAWAGYQAVKKENVGVAGGAVTGLFGGFVSGLIVESANTAKTMMAGSDTVQTVAAMGPATLAIGIVLTIGILAAIDTVVGAVGGAIGAFIAGMKK